METFVTIMGWIAVVLLCFAALLLVAWCALKAFDSVTQWHYGKAYNAAMSDLGRAVYSSAHWFSEDTATYSVLSVLGERLQKHEAVYIGTAPQEWREEWRKRFAKFNTVNRLEQPPAVKS